MLKIFRRMAGEEQEPSDQALLIHLNGTDLEDSVYEQYDLDGLEKAITAALGRTGEWDGTETGPAETTVFLYGRDAEQMFAKIESVIRDHPLCKQARIVVRKGGPGAVQREVQL
jgi:hypothetical protein